MIGNKSNHSYDLHSEVALFNEEVDKGQAMIPVGTKATIDSFGADSLLRREKRIFCLPPRAPELWQKLDHGMITRRVIVECREAISQVHASVSFF